MYKSTRRTHPNVECIGTLDAPYRIVLIRQLSLNLDSSQNPDCKHDDKSHHGFVDLVLFSLHP